ncbi:MAG: hypothetical protein QOJ15_2469 [Bradyrhizobium sp.]|nr:hypothetical protein [Bradyrhizobium sp.]
MNVSPQSQANRFSSRLLKRWGGTMQTKRINVVHCGQSGDRNRLVSMMLGNAWGRHGQPLNRYTIAYRQHIHAGPEGTSLVNIELRL